MDSSFREFLERKVAGILQHLSTDMLSKVSKLLIDEGVKKENDLRRITIPILKGVLDTVDSSDLYEKWQNDYGVAQSSSVGQSLQRPPLANRLQNVARAIVETPMPIYDKDSPFMPSGVRKAIEEKKRPSNRDREALVARIVDNCRDVVPNLTRSMFNKVAFQLVSYYPESFKDTIPVSETGSDSLAHQLKTKFDNDKRCKSSATIKEKQAPNIKEAYGCILWNPSLPDGETEDSQEDHRKVLKNTFKLSRKQWKTAIIREHMNASFYLQRKEINGSLVQATDKKRKRKQNDDETPLAGLSAADIHDRWPFLTTSKWSNYHFKTLTGVDFRAKLEEFLKEKGDLLIEYLACKSSLMAQLRRKMLRAQKRNTSADTQLICILMMLINHFGDSKEALVKFVPTETVLEEVADYATFPEESEPILFGTGRNMYDSTKFYISIDNKVLATEYLLSDAFTVLFNSYFIMNIEYAEGLSGLLVFTQRYIAGINVPKGTKCRTTDIMRKANSKVTKLSNELKGYQEQLGDEENDSP